AGASADLCKTVRPEVWRPRHRDRTGLCRIRIGRATGQTWYVASGNCLHRSNAMGEVRGLCSCLPDLVGLCANRNSGKGDCAELTLNGPEGPRKAHLVVSLGLNC